MATGVTAAGDAGAAGSSPGLGTKLAYGFGAIALGVKENGLSYFLLLFYSQVVGLDARLVSLALTVALVLDAFIDPMIGYWSDNLRSKWGRRHPFMYLSAAPIALAYFFLWDPPRGLSGTAQFLYLLIILPVIRLSVSFYEIPVTSLAPELTRDYDQRSTLGAFSSYFAWTGGNAMSVFMFGVLFPLFATQAIPNGQFNRDAYRAYGIIASVLMLVSIVVCSVGTHGRIRLAPPAAPKRDLTPKKIFAEIFETLSNRSFIALFISSIFGSIAAGLSASMASIFYAYFWRFSSQQSSFITMGVFGSAILGALLAPVVSRTIGKKKGAIIIGLLAFLGSPTPIVLRLFHLLPPNHTPTVFWLVFVTNLLDVGLIICFQILSGAMMADLVEQAEVKTGRRNEGIFFATSAFIRKIVNGGGVILAGLVLTFAGLKTGADAAHVPDAALWRLGAAYVPTILFLWMAMLAVMAAYTLTRAGHEENLRTLARTRAEAEAR